MVLSCYKGAYIHIPVCTSGSRNVVKGQPSAKIVGASQCAKRGAILITIIILII